MEKLELVLLDDLIKEVDRRCVCFVMAYTIRDPQDKEIYYSYYGKGKHPEACHLSDLLHNDCLNNWNGELRLLQRIADEGGL